MQISSATTRLFLKSLIYVLILSGCSSPNKTDSSVEDSFAVFQLLHSDSTGIDFNMNGSLLYKGDVSGLYSNIAGVAAGDINNDGLVDLFFSGGRANSQLYLNQGDFQFKDITKNSGIHDKKVNQADNQGVNFVDINGDGFLDIYICKTGLAGNFAKKQFNSVGANLLYINQGDLSFKESAEEYGLNIIGLSHTANFFDYDGDGDLDLYLIQTGEPGSTFSLSYYQAPPRFRWLSDRFYENQNGYFRDVTEKVGLPLKRSIGLSVSVGDVNNDGFQDLYVANDFFGPDFFYINNTKGKFIDKREEFFSKTPMSSMGSDFADYNNDGYIDLFVGEMMPVGAKRQKMNLVPFSLEIYDELNSQGAPQYTRNMLQENHGGKYYKDIGMMENVYATEWSWSSFFLDANNDGFKDLFVSNGILRDMTNMDFVKDNVGENYTDMGNPEVKSKMNPLRAPSTKTSNYIYQNVQGHFVDRSTDWNLHHKEHVRGATYADLDRDGDLDLVLTRIDDTPLIYKNKTDQLDRNYIQFRLKGPHKNTFGIGASIHLYIGNEIQHNYISTQRGFQSSPEPFVHFGLGTEEAMDSVIVTWPGGYAEKYLNLEPNSIHDLVYKKGEKCLENQTHRFSKYAMTLQNTAYKHKENSFNDFKQQRILTKKYSKMGPGMAVQDINSDQIDDLVISGAKGFPATCIQSNEGSEGTISSIRLDPNKENHGMLLFDGNNDGLTDLYICNGGNESSREDLTDYFIPGEKNGGFDLKRSQKYCNKQASSVITASDFDQDGDLDLFVGSNIVPGDYGQQPSSTLLINDNGIFIDATVELLPELRDIGRVNAALWSDANNDGKIDLLIIGEWMPLTIFYQTNDGKFSMKAIDQSSGWWNSLTGADLDNDGDMDYIAGNHGLNSIFKATKNKPIQLVSADFDNSGSIDPVVFHYIGDKCVPFVNRDLFTSQMPIYNNEFYSFEKYAQASCQSIISPEIQAKTKILEVTELQSSAFINQGNGNFKIIPLPKSAQNAPVFGILPLDYNEDGNIDLMITGNDCSFHYEYGCIDALGIQLLLGDGSGQFLLEKSFLTTSDDFEGRSLTYASDPSNKIRLFFGNNNGAVQSMILPSYLQAVKCPKGTTHVNIRLKNGSNRKKEIYYGEGYLSQLPNSILTNSSVSEVRFYRGNELLN